MEDLFWTTLDVNGRVGEYHIIFENEEYCFVPKDPSMKQYKFKREHDEWHSADSSSEEVIENAVEALEKYLLRQH